MLFQGPRMQETSFSVMKIRYFAGGEGVHVHPYAFPPLAPHPAPDDVNILY